MAGIIHLSKELIQNCAVVICVYAFQLLLHQDLFRCPCVHHGSYGTAFLVAPAIFLLGLSLVICKRSWAVISACWKYSKHTTKCNYFLDSLVDFFRPFLAPVSWIILALFRGDCYVCIRGGSNTTCSSGDHKTKAVDFDRLYAQSFVIGSACLVAMVIFATGIVCIQRFCTNHAECLSTSNDFNQMKNKAVTKAFEEYAQEIAKDFAVKLVETSFNVRDSEIDVDERFNIARERMYKSYEHRGPGECMVNCPENEYHAMDFTPM